MTHEVDLLLSSLTQHDAEAQIRCDLSVLAVGVTAAGGSDPQPLPSTAAMARAQHQGSFHRSTTAILFLPCALQLPAMQ